MSTILRRLQLADIPEITELIASAFASQDLGQDVSRHLAGYASSDQCSALITEQTSFHLPAEYWVAVDTNTDKLIALSGIYRFWWTSRECLWLGWFCVEPSRQQEGIGSAVIRQTMAIARARGAGVFKVETDVDSTAAHFYEKQRFVREAVLTGHYSGGKDALILTRTLLDIQVVEIKELYKLEYI
jgi:ribosomal protein S18 acetylase RimI-like enzyme